MPVNGRGKGASAEREVAGLLQAWWAGVEPDCRFVRVPMSGGWHGPEVRKEFRASGDVMTTALSFPWAVEVKRRERWKLENVLEGKPSPAWEWWAQARGQAEESGLEPMLWFRRNRGLWKVMVDGSLTFTMTHRLVLESFGSDASLPVEPTRRVDVGASRPVVIDAAWILGQDPARYRRPG